MKDEEPILNHVCSNSFCKPSHIVREGFSFDSLGFHEEYTPN